MIKTGLPIQQVIPQVKSALAKGNSLIVDAPPGAGKSTVLPLALMDEPFLNGKKILMLEPRRLATKSIAWRMASLLEEEVGQRIGYRIRFESIVSNQTQIEVLTEGILTRRLLNDNALEDVGMVIFDEFHERNIHADLAFALCRETQQILRPDLKIMLMSATMDFGQLAKLTNAEVIRAEGKSYPVDIHFTRDYDLYDISETVSRETITISKKEKGDILVFLPGQGEIKATEALLKKSLPEFKILPLYGQLSPTAQHQAILPDKNGRRKIVLATSIAETSLTIEGISTVVDSGFGRYAKFNPKTGLTKLETIRISKDSADQRAGRAGRLGPGACYRLWSKATQEQIVNYRNPEILEADLSPLALDLSIWGIESLDSLDWLTPPPSGNYAQAKSLLESIGAIENGKITPHGKAIHRIPAHPRIANMLILAVALDKAALATDIAAILEERDPLSADSGTDINLRIEAMRRARKEGLRIKGINKLEKVAAQYRKLLKVEADYGFVDSYETGILIASAYPERIACARPGNNAQFQMANGKIVKMSHKDELAHESWLAISHVDEREGIGKIFMASPIDPKDLKPFIKEVHKVAWDNKLEAVTATSNLYLGNILLKSTASNHYDEAEIKKVLLESIKESKLQILPWDEKARQLQNRATILRQTYKEDNWPEFSNQYLMDTINQWLAPYLLGIRKQEQLDRLDLTQILLDRLSYEQQKMLQELLPEKIKVPSGSMVKIEYRTTDLPPILSVRLQEVFGWTKSPVLNQGKTKVLLHLLSPGFKPVQVTDDLESFWNNTYFEVKKELKRRYPKHYWPDNPLQAEAVKGVKRK